MEFGIMKKKRVNYEFIGFVRMKVQFSIKKCVNSNYMFI